MAPPVEPTSAPSPDDEGLPGRGTWFFNYCNSLYPHGVARGDKIRVDGRQPAPGQRRHDCVSLGQQAETRTASGRAWSSRSRAPLICAPSLQEITRKKPGVENRVAQEIEEAITA